MDHSALIKVVDITRCELRWLGKRAEKEIRYKQLKNNGLLHGESREILFDNYQKYSDAAEMAEMFLRGTLSLGEFIEELNRFNLEKFTQRMLLFNPDVILKNV